MGGADGNFADVMSVVLMQLTVGAAKQGQCCVKLVYLA